MDLALAEPGDLAVVDTDGLSARLPERSPFTSQRLHLLERVAAAVAVVDGTAARGAKA